VFILFANYYPSGLSYLAPKRLLIIYQSLMGNRSKKILVQKSTVRTKLTRLREHLAENHPFQPPEGVRKLWFPGKIRKNPEKS